ncbi:hypothetical protein [Streptomyces gobiensis]|uniref:hypothetical protein n=1 Tax=Streptomyces gobiensis TaxID=2875706 RepID=UPI001E2951F6|nr:hypothetical protein [Streptomyces gobiensis]UGY92041.1 hypothetical protein test1122_10105 [Streptomyces gobiensis]
MTTHSRQGDEPREGVVLPSNGEPWIPGQSEPQQVTPDQGQPWGQPWGPADATPHPPAAAPPPPPQQLPPPPAAPPPMPAPPLPPQAAPQGPADETQLLPPQGLPPQGSPPPSLPPQGGLPPAPGTQPWGHPPAAPNEDATQFMPPFGAADAESTQLLRNPLPPEAPTGQQQPSPVPPPPPGAPYGIRPGAPGDRQPPTEFDNLFRPEPKPEPGPEAHSPAATQQLPVFNQAAAAQERRQPYQGPYDAPYSGHGGSHEDGKRKPSPVVLGAIAVAVLIGGGMLGGAALGGGGDDDKKDEQQRNQANASAAEVKETQPATDPVEEQAKELDKLLASSNNSRDAVIRSVENIKKCEKLGKAAADLRDAADQRNALVTRLNELSIDQLPNHERLSAELTKAWKASAAADHHYAAWAGQVAGKKGCPKGQARTTGQHARGNRASGVATAAKQQAARLWNPIARTYDLTERQPTQL